MTKAHPCLILLILATSAAPTALANATRLPSQDDWAVARGLAVVASVNSPAAIYYNPAGLTNVGAAEIKSGAEIISPSTSFTSAATGRTIDEQSDSFFQPRVFVATPLGKDLVLGAGVYSPFGQSTDWQTSSGFAGLATFNEIKYVTGAVSLGYKLSPDLSLGASLQFSHIRVSLNRLTPIAPGVARAFTFQGDDNALSANLGFQWSPIPDHRFGVQYQRKTDFYIEGTATLAGVASQAGTVGWVFPDNISAGWQWDFTPGWQGEISVDRTNWSKVKTLHLNAGFLSSVVPLQWKTSSYYGVGVSRKLDADWSVASGYTFSENSVPDATFSPSLPDVSRHLLNAGVFWSHGKWKVGAVLQRGFRATRTITGPAPDGLGGSAAGTYSNSLWAADLSLGYKF